MTSPKILLKAWNIHPQKQLGQNFLLNPSTSEMIVRNAKITNEDIILEIGAGFGALTIPAALAAKTIYAVEKDSRVIDLLKTELIANNIYNVVVLNEDILKFDIKKLSEKINRNLIVIGNLPYKISSQIIVELIGSRNILTKAVLMLQKEMVCRLIAKPGTKDYGRISVMLQYCSHIKKLADVSSQVFFPKPNVDSQVIELTFKDTTEYGVYDQDILFMVIKAGFSKRRKTLRNALAGTLMNLDTNDSARLLEIAEIDQLRRAETLSIEEFVRLSNCFVKKAFLMKR